jgi:CxxC-x17-CxxC domain-containing protein
MYSDETLTCTDCGGPFVFTAGEQSFFAQKGFTNKPNRCPDCRAARKASGGRARSGGAAAGGGGFDRGEREMFSAKCSQCGQEARVPFQPRSDKPVYCRDCFQSRQPARY